jgi:hypothetical protein
MTHDDVMMEAWRLDLLSWPSTSAPYPDGVAAARLPVARAGPGRVIPTAAAHRSPRASPVT